HRLRGHRRPAGQYRPLGRRGPTRRGSRPRAGAGQSPVEGDRRIRCHPHRLPALARPARRQRADRLPRGDHPTRDRVLRPARCGPAHRDHREGSGPAQPLARDRRDPCDHVRFAHSALEGGHGAGERGPRREGLRVRDHPHREVPRRLRRRRTDHELRTQACRFRGLPAPGPRAHRPRRSTLNDPAVQEDQETPPAGDASGGQSAPSGDAAPAGEEAAQGFQVELENFSGPFDLLLGLISKRRLDVTEIALAEVTDEFIAYTTELKDQANLAEISQFLLVAATLLDLKTARLLPHEEGEEVLDLELLEARDLLFARLLQYKAYKSVSGYLAEAMAAGSIRTPREVGLEAEFQNVLPPLELDIGPGELAGIFATVLQRDHTPPTVAVDHIHLPLVSVSEQRGHILSLLRTGEVDFAQLMDTAEN